jgi:hypothetical protein
MRTKQYVNYLSRRNHNNARREELKESKGHDSVEQKLEASLISREVYEEAKLKQWVYE